jgi:hypothetical protein
VLLAAILGPFLAIGIAAAGTSAFGLSPGDSVTVSCAGSTLSVTASSSSQDTVTCAPLADLVLNSMTISPANPMPGQAVTFSASVTNIGTVPTPSAFGTAFFVDGVKVSWRDASGTLAAGATAIYTANDGPSGSAMWTATSGSHAVKAVTNDMAVFTEVSTQNNASTTTLSVPTTTSPPTSTTAPSTTSPNVALPAGYTSSQLIFDDTFSGSTLNSSHWRTYISDVNSGGYPWNSDGAGGSGSNAGAYDAEYFEPSALSVNSGLSVSATRGSNRSGYTWTSGVVTTQGLFAISKGYVQVRAWMPQMTTGMWPGIWLMGSKSELPEIDLYEGGYTPNPNSAFASNLHVSGASQQVVQTSTDLSGGWHVYGVDYEPGSSITFYLDGVQLAKYTSNIPSGPYFLLLNLQVAQNASGWHSLVGSTTQSPSVMKVSEVQAYGTAG